MKIETLTYEKALERYPTEVASCVAELRKSRRKNKNADPATLEGFAQRSCHMT